MATSSSVILLIVAGSFLGAAYGGDKLHVPPAQDISSFTFQLRTIYGNTSLSNGSLHSNMTDGDRRQKTKTELPPADDKLNIYALPVGQGDCTVIQCPRADGDRITIIDAGSSKVTGFTREDLVDFLRLDEVTIQSIFLTHPDLDHIKYIDAILDAYNDNENDNDNVRVYHSCDWDRYTRRIGRRRGRGRIVPAIRLVHENQRTKVHSCCGPNCNQDEHLVTLCEVSGVTLRVIGSEFTNNNCADDHKNEDSIVSTIEYQGIKTLITGDFEGNADFINRYLDCVGRGPDSYLRADIYRLSHHGADNDRENNNAGAKSANRREFLREINARNVFSSSGLHQGYKHPRCTVHDYYRNRARRGVAPHRYTCYTNDNRRRTSYGIITARYVTTVEQGQGYLNYIIKFSIDRNGIISSSATPT